MTEVVLGGRFSALTYAAPCMYFVQTLLRVLAMLEVVLLVGDLAQRTGRMHAPVTVVAARVERVAESTTAYWWSGRGRVCMYVW